MGRAMLTKTLTQFSADGQDCVPSLLFDLGPNYGGGDEDNGDFLRKVPGTPCCTQRPHPCSRPASTHTSTGDAWTFTGKSRSVSSGVTATFSWVLMCTSFCLCLPELFPQFCVTSGGSMVGLRATSSKRLCHTQVCCTRSPCPCSSPLLTVPCCGSQQTVENS